MLPGGHDHTLSVGVTVGPLLLRVGVLAALAVVAGHTLLRPFLTDPRTGPGHRAPVAGVAAAGVAVSFELLLSGGLVLPEQLVPVLLAGLVLPLYLLLSTDPRFARPVGLGRSLAPWAFTGMAAVSATVLGRAWFAGLPPDATATTLHTGVVLTFVTLAWFAVAAWHIVVRVLGIVLAWALIPATVQAVLSSLS